jgi:hypothetical protein
VRGARSEDRGGGGKWNIFCSYPYFGARGGGIPVKKYD